jgi:hypothetical protein
VNRRSLVPDGTERNPSLALPRNTTPRSPTTQTSSLEAPQTLKKLGMSEFASTGRSAASGTLLQSTPS